MNGKFEELPEELVLEIVSWIPYHLGAYDNLRDTNRKFSRILKTKSLPAKIAAHRYSAYFRLTRSIFPTISFNWRYLEHLACKTSAQHEWVEFLQRSTSLPLETIAAAIALSTTIADLKARFHGRVKQGRGFHRCLPGIVLIWSKLIRQALPPETLLLLRYISLKAYEAVQDNEVECLLEEEYSHDSIERKNMVALCQFSLYEMRLFSVYDLLEHGIWTVHNEYITQTLDRMALLAADVSENIEGDPGDYPGVAQEWIDQGLIICFAANHHLADNLGLDSILHENMDGPAAGTILGRLRHEYRQMQSINAHIIRKFEDESYNQAVTQRLQLEQIGCGMLNVLQEVHRLGKDDGHKLLGDDVELLGLDAWPVQGDHGIDPGF